MPAPSSFPLALLTGAFSLLRVRPELLAMLDDSPTAARRSFLLMLPVLPIYIFSIYCLADDSMARIPFGTLLPVLAADYVLQWVLFPMLVAGVITLAGMNRMPFRAFVIITNALSCLSAFLILPLLFLFYVKAVSEETLFMLLTAIFMVISLTVSRWAILLFKGGMGFGVIIFMLSSFSGQSISLATMELLRHYTEN